MFQKSYNKKFLIIFSFFFFLFVAGLIGFNFLLHYSTTDFWLALAIELALQFSLPINLWFIIMLCLFGIPFTYAWWNFVATVKQNRKTRYSVPEVETKIQQVLAGNRGESLSFVSLLHKVKFPGSLGEFNAILKRLLEENKITRTGSDDYPIYKAI
jgi:hypothetical protein